MSDIDDLHASSVSAQLDVWPLRDGVPRRPPYDGAMGRGSKSKVRWKNDRVKKTKERAKRVAREKGEARKG